jgi:hypothetical protein
LLDGSGKVVADSPDKEVMQLLFALASRLDASVCSARLRPYQSLSDWERRSKRRSQGSGSARLVKRWRIKRRHWVLGAVWLAALALSLAVGLRNVGLRSDPCDPLANVSTLCPDAPIVDAK